jgi:hypothetical protein
MNSERTNQTQTQRGARQSQSQGNRKKPDPHAPANVPDEEADTLSDEDYLEAEPHPDSRPDSRRDQTVDPERSGGAQDRSQSI